MTCRKTLHDIYPPTIPIVKPMTEKKTRLTDADMILVNKLKGNRTDRQIYMAGLGVSVEPLKRGRPSQLDQIREKDEERMNQYNQDLAKNFVDENRKRYENSTTQEDLYNIFFDEQKKRKQG